MRSCPLTLPTKSVHCRGCVPVSIRLSGAAWATEAGPGIIVRLSADGTTWFIHVLVLLPRELGAGLGLPRLGGVVDDLPQVEVLGARQQRLPRAGSPRLRGVADDPPGPGVVLLHQLLHRPGLLPQPGESLGTGVEFCGRCDIGFCDCHFTPTLRNTQLPVFRDSPGETGSPRRLPPR